MLPFRHNSKAPFTPVHSHLTSSSHQPTDRQTSRPAWPLIIPQASSNSGNLPSLPNIVLVKAATAFAPFHLQTGVYWPAAGGICHDSTTETRSGTYGGKLPCSRLRSRGTPISADRPGPWPNADAPGPATTCPTATRAPRANAESSGSTDPATRHGSSQKLQG